MTCIVHAWFRKRKDRFNCLPGDQNTKERTYFSCLENGWVKMMVKLEMNAIPWRALQCSACMVHARCAPRVETGTSSMQMLSSM